MWQTVSDFFVYLIHQLCLYDNSDSPRTGKNPSGSAAAANDDTLYSYSRSILSQRLDDRSSVNLGPPGPGGRRRSSSIHGAGSISGVSRIGGSGGAAIINDRDNLDISGVANNLRGPGSGTSSRGSASNIVQAQIERMFNDVAKEHGDGPAAAAAAPSVNGQTFQVRCLGSLPLKDKVTSLVGLQEPLWQLYLSGAGHGVSCLFFFLFLMEIEFEYHRQEMITLVVYQNIILDKRLETKC
ncbi:hypothetical protein quinque_001184 [Culex quinquefasciatus]